MAEAVFRHARECPELTLGVAAFSVKQMQAVYDEVERMRMEDNSCEEFFGAHEHEPFFVKNLENVQGDERDVIFISVGFGRDQDGKVSMNFGPLNSDGGERRLKISWLSALRKISNLRRAYRLNQYGPWRGRLPFLSAIRRGGCVGGRGGVRAFGDQHAL